MDVSKTLVAGSGDRVPIGTSLGYLLSVENTGNTSLVGIEIEDTLPSGLRFEGVGCDGPVNVVFNDDDPELGSGQIILTDIGLEPGARFSITVRVSTIVSRPRRSSFTMKPSFRHRVLM